MSVDTTSFACFEDELEPARVQRFASWQQQRARPAFGFVEPLR